MTKLLNIFANSLTLLAIISCTSMQTSDFEVMVKLPASEDCYGVRVMSGEETRYSAFACVEMMKRAIFLTSDNWRLVRQDIQTNCQYSQCQQITGAADGLFLAIDRGLQKLPF